jgi:arylsulfatase A-like enzyme
VGTLHHRSRVAKAPLTFTAALRQAGYFVQWAAKKDFNFEPAADFADSEANWVDACIHADFFEQCAAKNQPCFLYHNFAVTHESSMWRHEPDLWGAYRERLAQETLLSRLIELGEVVVPEYLADTPEVRGDLVRYYEALAIQDAQIGAVLAALAASPLADSTYAMYLSDHGRGLLREKRWCYAPGLHMPLVMRGPGIASGTQHNGLISWVDIAPTVCDLAEVARPDYFEGVNFLTEPRSYAFAGRDRMDEVTDAQRAVTDGTWLYVQNLNAELPWSAEMSYQSRQLTTKTMCELHTQGRLTGVPAQWFASTKPPEELYSLADDPACVRNCIEDTAAADARQRLRDALAYHGTAVPDLGRLSEQALVDDGILVGPAGGAR